MNRAYLVKFCASFLGLAGFTFFAPAIWAQSASPALQRQVEELAATSQRNFQDLAKAMNSFAELKTDVQSVKGQLESAKYLTKENEKVYQDLDTRVAGLEDKIGQIHTMIKEMRMGATSDPAAPKPAAIGPQAQQAQEFEEFQGLLNLFNAQDYRGAASGMMGFLKKYPQSTLSGNAQYWVAESFFSMGDYVKAIAEYQSLSEKYPAHARVREGIYKQGVSFQKLKKTPEAKLFYQKVIANYSGSPEALKAQARLSRMESLESASAPLALEMNPSATPKPKPTPRPTPTAQPHYHPNPPLKNIPHPGAKLPPEAPNPPGPSPRNPPQPAPQPAAPAPAPAPAPSQPTAPKLDNSGAPLF